MFHEGISMSSRTCLLVAVLCFGSAQGADPRAGRPEGTAIGYGYNAMAYSYSLAVSGGGAQASSAYSHAYAAYVYLNYAWNVAYYGYLDGSVSEATYEYLIAVAAQNAYYGYQAIYAAHLANPTSTSTTAFWNFYYLQQYLFQAYAAGVPYDGLTWETRLLRDMHNNYRQTIGRTRLRVDHRLQASAQGHANWMAANQTMSHTGAGGTTPLQRAVAQGYSGSGYGIGENIAFGYPDVNTVFQAWLASPGHKANIDNASFVHVGIAVATASNGQRYWAVEFGYIIP
jgi:uncharacterized protein YkwD